MSELFSSFNVTVSLSDQIAAIEREIKPRERIYPNRILTRRMSQTQADLEIAKMRAVLKTLQALAAERRA